MKLTVYFRPEEEGGWLAVIPRLIGAAHSEDTKEAALLRVQSTALRLIARQLDRGQLTQEEARSIEFELSDKELSIAELAALSPKPTSPVAHP
jgi:predicted RNase H-like HicB family nuclease